MNKTDKVKIENIKSEGLDEIILKDLLELREKRNEFKDCIDPLGSRIYAIYEGTYRHNLDLFNYTRDDVSLYEEKEKIKLVQYELNFNK